MEAREEILLKAIILKLKDLRKQIRVLLEEKEAKAT